ncbi:BCD family MFS transporter [Alsobacter sp. KACC 23698]|uniref:BCD family MFS transporter n=1 Tax=Alsobacter sp. KACC 23698 TaxID=3149229 RepID=A0AAU7JDM2_9HYPH
MSPKGLMIKGWMRIGPRMLPFADAVSTELPAGRLLRLSLFQVTVGMAAVLLIGTLNRVMIVELGLPAWLVALMVSLPLVFAPLRAVVGHRSDHHRSFLGWRRVPYLWFGALLQFGGLAIMPFALILLSGDSNAPAFVGQGAAALAFLLVGAGLHTVQTVGLALATDIAPVATRPRVVALLCTMLLVGMVASAILFGWLLHPFSQIRLIQVIQGAAVATMALNLLALWKQEPRGAPRREAPAESWSFAQSWSALTGRGDALRLFAATGLGTAAFSMQDILLEPYGGQILTLSVAATTALTAALAAGGLAGLALAARRLNRGADPHRVAALGALAGVAAFSAVIFAAPLASALVFGLGVALIGFGGGLFAHGTLTASMAIARNGETGIALGAWGAVQASAAGVAIATGGALKDVVSDLATSGALGVALTDASVGYSVVYHIEIALLFATLIAIGPLVRGARRRPGSAASITFIEAEG